MSHTPSQMVGLAMLGALLVLGAIGVIVATALCVPFVPLAVVLACAACLMGGFGFYALALAGSAASDLEDALDRPQESGR